MEDLSLLLTKRRIRSTEGCPAVYCSYQRNSQINKTKENHVFTVTVNKISQVRKLSFWVIFYLYI